MPGSTTKAHKKRNMTSSSSVRSAESGGLRTVSTEILKPSSQSDGKTSSRTSGKEDDWESIDNRSHNVNEQSKLQLSSLGLYGRNEEIQTLQECLKRFTVVTAKGEPNMVDPMTPDPPQEQPKSHRFEKQDPSKRKQMVFVSGISGTGKSSLIEHALMKQVRHHTRGLFVSGKFDYLLRDKPFSGIVGACGEIGRELMARQKRERQGVVATIRQELRMEMGDDASESDLTELLRLFPTLEYVLGDEPRQGGDFDKKPIQPSRSGRSLGESSSSAASMDMKYRLMNAFKIFLRIIAANFQPVVIMLDDLQWADSCRSVDSTRNAYCLLPLNFGPFNRPLSPSLLFRFFSSLLFSHHTQFGID